MNRKGELQTSRISSNLRIGQSYSRVPQILKLLCVCYSWKYVARLGFEPLKFLYGEFLYNTQTVLCFYCDYPCWNPNVICSPTSLPSGTQTFCLMENQQCIKLHSDYVCQHQKKIILGSFTSDLFSQLSHVVPMDCPMYLWKPHSSRQ